jgi:hypothetical protein
MDKRPTPYDGKKALIVGNHPHEGEKATCNGANTAAGRWGLIFKSDDNGEEFYVFDPQNVKWINYSKTRDN